MKKIPLISYLERSRNAEHYRLQEELLAAITADFASTYKIDDFRTNYADLFAKEDEAYLQNQAYADTQPIDQADSTRDQRFRYLDLLKQTKQLSPVAAEKAAADRVAYGMKPYLGASSKPNAENTAMVSDLVKLLQSDAYAADVQTLGMTDAVVSLKAANDAFEAIYSHRADEKLVRANSDNLKKIRPEVDEAFRRLADAINAIYLVAETIERDATKTAAIGAVIDAVNAQILQFSETLSRRGASKGKQVPGKPGEEGGGEVTPPDPDENPDIL